MKLSPNEMKAMADDACTFLKALASPHRLLILCALVEGERSVGEIAAMAALRQANVSQHLALLRKDGIVAARRDGQTMWYRISNPAAGELLQTLYRLYCSTDPVGAQSRKRTSHAIDQGMGS